MNYICWYYKYNKHSVVVKILLCCLESMFYPLRSFCAQGYFSLMLVMKVSRVDQYSVWLQTARPVFDPRHRRKGFSSGLCVQTASGTHPASCTMGTGNPFSGATARPGRDADHSSHLVPRSRMSRSYTSSPLKSLRGV
jgi:hypothetical protein